MEREKHFEPLINAARAEYEEQLEREVQILRADSRMRAGAKLDRSRTESKAELTEQLCKLRADGAEKLAQQLGAERERLRAQILLSISTKAEQL